MKEAINKLLSATKQVADEACHGANILANKGKKKIDQLSLENELGKAQRQLGALVYSLAKSGEQNEALVQQYIDIVAAIEEELNALTEKAPADVKVTNVCPSCGKEVAEGAMFCSGCGARCAK
ncbi:MAG: zinc ribbon domain-containing protein [Oscillospiraceae bacterium]|nr:zinc ribbon domain-containing protein [Oscillospiraceae bacterium]